VQEGAEGAHGVGDAATLRDDVLVRALSVDVPLPGVLEGANLRAGLRAVLLGEEEVVVLAGVEGRIEVDEVYGLILDPFLQNELIVAVVELVLFRSHGLWER
jgi:hypothetical protein